MANLADITIEIPRKCGRNTKEFIAKSIIIIGKQFHTVFRQYDPVNEHEI